MSIWEPSLPPELIFTIIECLVSPVDSQHIALPASHPVTRTLLSFACGRFNPLDVNSFAQYLKKLKEIWLDIVGPLSSPWIPVDLQFMSFVWSDWPRHWQRHGTSFMWRVARRAWKVYQNSVARTAAAELEKAKFARNWAHIKLDQKKGKNNEYGLRSKLNRVEWEWNWGTIGGKVLSKVLPAEILCWSVSM